MNKRFFLTSKNEIIGEEEVLLLAPGDEFLQMFIQDAEIGEITSEAVSICSLPSWYLIRIKDEE